MIIIGIIVKKLKKEFASFRKFQPIKLDLFQFFSPLHLVT